MYTVRIMLFHKNAFDNALSCPMERRLKRSANPWRCTVSLRIVADAAGRPLNQMKNLTFGSPIMNPDDVMYRFRRAEGNLNPSKEPLAFLTDKLGMAFDELSFSPNYVSILVQVEGSNMEDLSVLR